MDIIKIIQENSLTVRCLPNIVINRWSYREGETSFRNAVLKEFPDGRKYWHEEIKVEHGGWWYVKETPDTSSTVRFSRKYDKFFAPTIEEALQLYIEDKKKGGN